MNWIDIALCVPLLWGLYRGFTKGFVIEVASLIALVLGVWGGIHFSDYTAQLLHQKLGWESDFMPVIAFAITFVAIVVSIYLLARVLEKVVNMVAMKLVNKVAGAVFGMVKVGLMVSIGLLVVESFDRSLGLLPAEQKTDSILYQPVLGVATTVIPGMKNSNLFELLEEGREMLPDTDSTASGTGNETASLTR